MISDFDTDPRPCLDFVRKENKDLELYTSWSASPQRQLEDFYSHFFKVGQIGEDVRIDCRQHVVAQVSEAERER